MQPIDAVATRITNTRVQAAPYPHLYATDVFPQAYYNQILEHLPPREAFRSLFDLGRTSIEYPERGVMPLTAEFIAQLSSPAREFWHLLAVWMTGRDFGNLMLKKFATGVRQRFAGAAAPHFASEAFVVRDRTNYALGPHTDSESKVLSFLFYLPKDDARPHLGTSIYQPRVKGFTCPGGPHHSFNDFELVTTMRYVPNSLFAFLKTPNSFHGVERVADEGVQRDVIQFNIRTL